MNINRNIDVLESSVIHMILKSLSISLPIDYEMALVR